MRTDVDVSHLAPCWRFVLPRTLTMSSPNRYTTLRWEQIFDKVDVWGDIKFSELHDNYYGEFHEGWKSNLSTTGETPTHVRQI